MPRGRYALRNKEITSPLAELDPEIGKRRKRVWKDQPRNAAGTRWAKREEIPRGRYALRSNTPSAELMPINHELGRRKPRPGKPQPRNAAGTRWIRREEAVDEEEKIVHAENNEPQRPQPPEEEDDEQQQPPAVDEEEKIVVVVHNDPQRPQRPEEEQHPAADDEEENIVLVEHNEMQRPQRQEAEDEQQQPPAESDESEEEPVAAPPQQQPEEQQQVVRLHEGEISVEDVHDPGDLPAGEGSPVIVKKDPGYAQETLASRAKRRRKKPKVEEPIERWRSAHDSIGQEAMAAVVLDVKETARRDDGMSDTDGKTVRLRKNVDENGGSSRNDTEDDARDSNESAQEDDDKSTRLTLMEQILLLGLKDREGRVGRLCGGLRVLSSYWIGQDSTYKFFEVILVDPSHKAIRRCPDLQWITKPVHMHRERRGLTAAGRKSRGLGKGDRYSQTRGGSQAKNWLRKNTKVLRRKR
ncbi:unnamed protein product, partial [Mesorhabditis spiculigera]